MPYRGELLNTHMDRDFQPVIKLMLFVMIVLWLFATCVACSMSRNPAKQQQNTTSTISQPAHNQPPGTPIPVDQIDQDRDGTISATERQSLIGDQPSVLLTFVTIVGMVIMVSVTTAWASKRWGADRRSPHEPELDTSSPPEEPAAPRSNGTRRETDTFL